MSRETNPLLEKVAWLFLSLQSVNHLGKQEEGEESWYVLGTNGIRISSNPTVTLQGS